MTAWFGYTSPTKPPLRLGRGTRPSIGVGGGSRRKGVGILLLLLRLRKTRWTSRWQRQAIPPKKSSIQHPFIHSYEPRIYQCEYVFLGEESSIRSLSFSVSPCSVHGLPM